MTALSVPTTAPPRPRASCWSVVEYQMYVGRRMWRSVVVVSVFQPLAYVLALGVGLGAIVDSGGRHPLGVSYLVFVAPAFLAASALQIATADASYPIMAGFEWMRTFHGMAATPLTPTQICDGQLIFVALRVTLNSGVFLGIMAAFGGTERWGVLLAVPIATLTAMSFAAPMAALAATLEREGNGFNIVFRFVVVPMFLFSGTFYPISELPHWGQWLAWVTPLWHGTELARGVSIGGLSAGATVVHLVYLTAWTVAGIALARWRFRVRVTA